MSEQNLLKINNEGSKQVDLEEAKELSIRAIHLVEKEQLNDAMPLLLKAQELWEKWEVQNIQLADVHEALGTCYYYFGKFELSIDYYKQSLNLRLTLLDSEKHPSIFTNYRNLALVYAAIGKFNLALNAMQKAMELAKLVYTGQHEEIAVCYRELAHILTIKGDLDGSLQNNFKALSIFEALNENIDFNIALTLNNISNTFNQKGDFQLAKEYLNKAHKFLEQHPNEYNQFAAIIYTSLGSIYTKFNKLQKGNYYFDKALKRMPKKHIHIIQILLLKTQLYLSWGRFQDAESLIKKAEESITEEHFILNIDCQLNFGSLYEQQQQFDKAHFHFKTAVQYAEKAKNQHNQTIVEAFLLYGKHLLFHSQEMKEAQKYLHKVLLLHKESKTFYHESLNYVNYLLSIFYQKNNNFNLAFEHAQACINHSLSDYKLKNHFVKIPLESILSDPKKIFDIRGLLGGIKQRASLFFDMYLQKKQNHFLTSAVENYQDSIALLTEIRQSYLSDKDTLLLIKKHQDIYPNALNVALNAQSTFQDKQFGNLAFDISEKSKASILLLQKQENQAKKNTAIPHELLEKEKNLKIQICYLEKSIQRTQQSKKWEDTELLARWEKEYAEKCHKFEAFKKQLETDYPDYYLEKYSSTTVSIEALQQALQKNQTILSYFIGEEKIYLFAITKNEYEIFVQEKPKEWSVLLQSYLKSIKFHQKTQFQERSFKLYQLLIQEAMHHLIDPFTKQQRQLFIIPHAELHYLPFETLIIQEAEILESYQKLDYLLNHCQISYHYSATLLHLDLQKQAIAEPAPKEMSFTGFAPVYDSISVTQQKALKVLQNESTTAVNRSEAVRSDGTWMPLPHSKIEVENISQLFQKEGLKSQAFLYETANKSNLEKQIGNSRFVLIAAHGIVNDEYPELSGLVLAENTEGEKRVKNSPSFEKHGDIWNENKERSSEQIAVEDCILNMKEVAMIPMNADLVVLSSCESGIGELHKGEGMMAVNRGFLASGAKNVVSTLFKVNDRASSELTQLLFAHILKGEDYTTALQKAKLELLMKEGMSPKAWSGFVLFGTGV